MTQYLMLVEKQADGSVTSRQIVPVSFVPPDRADTSHARARRSFVAIGLLSACVLAYEVLLTRLFSIVLWHHFAYMIISAAMLGYGASGTALTLLKEKIAPHVGTVYVIATAGMAFLMPAAFLLPQQVPFNPLELLWDKTQLAKLLAIYLLMMLPFFCGGLGIGFVLWHFGKEAGRIYAFDILGAGTGSLGVIGMLFLVPPHKVLVVLTALALLAAAIAVIETEDAAEMAGRCVCWDWLCWWLWRCPALAASASFSPTRI